MRAARYFEFGPARSVLRIDEIDDPTPGPGEVRVRLATSGVNPSDTKQRGAVVKRPITFPVIPHSDGAGVIDLVGAGVPEGRVGERVWVYNAQFMCQDGSAAEYVVLPTAMAVALPAGTDFAAGACFGIPALTAHRAVNIFGPVDGLTVLVQGGAGAVGNYAVQFAKAGGARVIATISSEAKAAHARAAGADATINYRSEDIEARVRELTDGKGVDRIVENSFSENGGTYHRILAMGGMAAIYGATTPTVTIGAQPFLGLEATLRFVSVYRLDPEPRAQAIADIRAMCEAGTLKHTIAARFPLEEIAAAHELVESGGAMGNVVIDIAELD